MTDFPVPEHSELRLTTLLVTRDGPDVFTLSGSHHTPLTAFLMPFVVGSDGDQTRRLAVVFYCWGTGSHPVRVSVHEDDWRFDQPGKTYVGSIPLDFEKVGHVFVSD